MKKTGTLIIIIAAVGVIIISGCITQPEYTGPVEEIVLAGYCGDTGALVYLAEQQGYFENNGLNVTLNDYEAGKLAADALIAGEADVSTSAGFVFVSNSFDLPDLRILGTVSAAEIIHLVARKDKGINQPSDLKGKKVGVTKSSAGEFFLGSFLAFNGLSLNDIEVVDLTPSEIVESVVNGEIDAGFTWEPNIYNIKNELGDNAISWPGQSGQDFYFALLTKQGWLDENPEAAKRFLRALLQAEDYMKDNPDEAKEFIKNRFNYEKDFTDYSWQNHEFVVGLPQAMLIAFEDQARWTIEYNLTDKSEVPNYLNYIYFDALDELKPEAITIIH